MAQVDSQILKELTNQYEETEQLLEATQLQFEIYKSTFTKDFPAEILILDQNHSDEVAVALREQAQTRAHNEEPAPAPAPLGVTMTYTESEAPEEPAPSEPIPSAKVSYNQKSEQESDRAPQLSASDTRKGKGSKFKRLYRTLCKKLHPDNKEGDETKFVELQKAYETGNSSAILRSAIREGLSLDEDPKEIDEAANFLKEDINRMKEEIEHLRKTIVWAWCTADQPQKADMKPRIIEHLRTARG